MAGAQVLSHSNGSHLNGYPPDDARPPTPAMLHQIAQFDKILQLREDLVKGHHPTLKLVAAASPVTSPRDTGVAASSQHASTNIAGQKPSSNLPQATGTSQSLPVSNVTQRPAAEPPRVPMVPQPAAPYVPDFDPVLLTKSEPLKRAEFRLERQRIEKRLDEQISHKRFSQKRETEPDSLPEFDVTEVLTQAQELVKPLTASELTAANDNNNASNSVDDSTFYSSQHNESDTEDRADVRATKPCRFFFEGKCLKGDRCDWSHDPAFKSKIGTTTGDGHEPNVVGNVGRRPLRPSPTYGPADGDSADQGMEDGEINEGSYSPPRNPPPIAYDPVVRLPPTATASHPDNSRHMRPDDSSRGHGGEVRPAYMHERRRSGRHSPGMGDARIVQNAITSPIAPQPARVSPLAVAKYPRIERVRQVAEDLSPQGVRQVPSAEQSPGSVHMHTPRKRQRRQSPSDTGRNVAARRYADSPEPYIKPEPISPAPFGEVSTRQVAHPVEPKSPVFYRQVHTGDGRVMYEEVRMPRAPVETQYVSRVASPAGRRVVSGPVAPYELRRETELRRVVSSRLQMRAVSPSVEYQHATPQREFYAPPSTHEPHRRPISRAHAPPEQEHPHSYRSSVQPLPAPTQSRPAPQRSPSPGMDVDQAGSNRREVPGMAPPRSTIMVDRYGTQYYEAQHPPVEYNPAPRGSIAPEQRYSKEMVYPGGHSRPSAYPEATRVYPETMREYGDRYVQRHSPEPASPRYVEYREMQPPRAVSRAASRAPVVYERAQNGDYGPVVEYSREYRFEEPPPPSRMAPVRASVVPIPPRQPIYIDDREAAYERNYRGPTTQPEVIRYIDAPRSGNVVRQVPAAREEPIEYREPPRQVYQYVDGPSDPHASRYAGAVMVDEHGRRLQRM